MVGSTFIYHNNTWCCSNSAALDIYNEPIIGIDSQISGIKQLQALSVDGVFNDVPQVDTECEFIFKPDEVGTTIAFKGRVKSVLPSLIITVLEPIKDHRYIIQAIKNNLYI